MMTPTNMDDVVDLRDVIARVEHLEPLREPGPVDLGDEDSECSQDELFAELAALEGLLAELKGYGGDEQWRGDWYPLTHIDWEAAARDLQQDYSTVEWDGVTYWYR